MVKGEQRGLNPGPPDPQAATALETTRTTMGTTLDCGANSGCMSSIGQMKTASSLTEAPGVRIWCADPTGGEQNLLNRAASLDIIVDGRCKKVNEKVNERYFDTRVPLLDREK